MCKLKLTVITCVFMSKAYQNYFMSTQSVFIANLKSLRKRKGYTQAQLATLIDKSFNYINGIECGVSFPPPDVIDRICETLEVKPVNLFDEDGCEENVFKISKDEIVKELSEKIYEQLKSDLRIEIKKGIEKALGQRY